MGVPPVPPAVSGDEEDDLAQLPPLDGDAGDAAEPERGEDDADADLGPEISPVDLDDSTGEGDAVDAADLGVEDDGGWLEEPADAPDLDLGAVDLESFEQALSGQEGDEGAALADELGLGEGLETGGLDSGEEGPEAPDEPLRDEDLPELGPAADDEPEDQLTDADRIGSDEPLGLGWAERPWARVGAPVPIATSSAIASAARGALVAGRVEARPPELLRVDLEGGCQAVRAEGLEGAIRSLAVADSVVVAVGDAGDVFVSRDDGETFLPVPGGGRVREAVVAGGIVWGRSEQGALLRSAAQGAPFEELSAAGPLVALASDGAGSVVGLAGDRAARPVAVVHVSPAGSLRRESIDLSASMAAGEAVVPSSLSIRGGQIAFATRRGVVLGTSDRGWQAVPIAWPVVALAFVEGGLVAAAYSGSDDTTGLVRLDAAGRPRVLALLGAVHAEAESDGRAVALACDDPRGVVWVAGGFGVAAFSTR